MSVTSTVEFVAVDWGTTNLRGYAVAGDGRIVDEHSTDEGVLSVARGRFPQVLEGLVERWPRVPTVLAGMVGSERGWQQIGYVDCPADVDAVAERMVPLATERPTWLVPGLRCPGINGGWDRMRGEETQLLGVMDGDGAGWRCLPGTHTKWARCRAGRVERFVTAMTGEVRAALLAGGTLGSLLEGEERSPDGNDDAFARGVEEASGAGGVLVHLFAARARVLAGELQPGDLAHHISGLLVGEELDGMARARVLPTVDSGGDVSISVVGGAALRRRYRRALELRGLEVREEDGASAFVLGVRRLLRARGGPR